MFILGDITFVVILLYMVFGLYRAYDNLNDGSDKVTFMIFYLMIIAAFIMLYKHCRWSL